MDWNYMNNLNYIFFDEFKKLDNVCKDIYGHSSEGNLGVTLYLEKMDEMSDEGALRIDGWSSDYARLKKLRHIRNELAHSENSFDYESCSQDDINFIVSFKERILTETDPISLLENRKNVKESGKEKKKTKPWQILVAIISFNFIIYLWIKKDIQSIYATTPKEDIAPIIITTVFVSLLKIIMIGGIVLLIRYIIDEIKSNKQ